MAVWFRDGNKAYRHLVERENVELRPFAPDGSFELGGVTCHLFLVPHRNENADTVALRFDGDGSSFVYVPDIDYWTERAEQVVRESDVALVDGTFFSLDEVDGRDVPHPTIPETMDRFSGCDTAINFTHLNNTNPAAGPKKTAYRTVTEREFDVAYDKQVFLLGNI